eukprot:gene6748-4867_t
MVIDLNLMKRSLPYELRALVMVKPANPGQMITWASAYVELFVNGVIQGNGMVSPPSWTKEFTLPFAYIDKTKEITVVFSRTGIVRSVVQKTSTHVLLGNIVQTNNPRTVIFEDKNVIGTVFWTVAENHLFRIYNLEEALSEGQLKDMVLTEESLSQRLKQKIIMLSLGLGSNCNGLIKEITNILTEGQPIVSDLDLMEILDDVNSVQGKNEFEKVIALLKDAEKDGRLRAVSYPASVPWFTKYLNMHVYDLWHNYRPDRVKMREIINAYAYADAWYHHQPNFLVQQRIQYQQRWLQRINQSADAKATARNPVQYSVQVHMRGEIKEISLETDELTTYIGLLRLLSLVKHYQTGVYNKQTIIDLQYPMIVVVMGGIFGGIHAEASADFQEECFDLEYMDPPSNAGGSSMFDQILPIRIPFEYIEAITLSHDHFLAYDSLLEIKLLGATSFTSSGASNYKFRLEMNGLGGQTFYHDFTLNQDVESRQPPSGALNASFHIFASSEQLKVKPTDPAPPTAHVSLSARMGTIVPQSIHSSPKKSLSKRDSFFSLTSSSSSSSSSNANDASAVAAATSATVQLPPVYLASNRDYTSLGHTNIALDIGMNQEKEMQIRLEKKRFAIHFALSQLQLADEEAIGTRDVYAIIYLADMYGQPFALSQGESNAPSSPKPTRQTSGSGSGSGSGGSQSSRKAVSMYDVQCLKRSARVNQSGHFTWEASERLTLDSHYYPVIENAAYFLVEIVAASDAASGSGAPMDRVLGEALIPIVYEELVDQEGDVLDVGQPTAHAIRLSEPVAMEFHQELVGDLIAATGYCLLQDPAASSSGTNTGTTSTMAAMGRASSRARARGNVVKLLASLKSIHPVDCAWPAHFLVNGKNAMDSTCCHVEILQEGLIIHVDNPSAMPTVGMSPFLAPSNQSSKASSSSSSSTTTSSFAWTLLQDCMERKSMSSDTIEVLIAYDHIYMEDVCALSNHTLYLAFKVRRKLIAAQTQKIGYREIRLELIVGPCLAEEMAAVICNRIAMFPMRSFLCQHIASVDRSQEEAFTRLVKMFQEGIYETISLIDSLKLLYLKMATLKLYLWYLIEQSPVEFSAERHYLESSWMLFEETEELSLDTLIYRINEVMRNLEQDVRRQVLRACRKNTGDISSGLTKIIYQKYLQVITMLHEAIDHTVKAPSLFAAAASAGGAGSSSFSDPSSQQAATRRGSSFSVGGNGASVTASSSSVGGLSRSTSRMDNNDFDDVFRGSQSHALSRTSTFGVGATAANTTAETMYVAVNPQKKRDLIKFVIVNDDIFENFLNSILRSHRYTFSKRPLLSLCLEFEDLIDEFGKILDENILMWNTRTLRHFMSSRDEQHVVAKAKELFISSIPETIQIQLNVEIGLKKVTPNAKFMSQQSMESLRRIDKMNIKIAQAIARSYVALASEYEKVMCTVLTQYAPWLLTVGANQEKDDLMCFVASIVNDCDRIAGTHIPQSVELFTQEYGFDPDQPHRPTSTSDGGGGGGRNSWWTRPRPGALGLLDEGGEMGGERSGAAGAAAAAGGGGPGGADGAHSNNISFATCLKAISAISRAALNELTNQAIFSSDVREYFLTGIDNRRVVTSASSENPFDKTLLELLKKLSGCLMSTVLHDWTGPEIVDTFLSLNFGMEPPKYVADVNKYDAALEKFFRHDAAFAHFIPLLNIMQDESSLREEYLDMYGERASAAAGARMSKIYFNGKVVTTSLRANSMATPQWEDVVAFPPIPLSQCKEIKVEIYGFRLRALKMRRQIYVGSLTISVVDVLRSEIAHQQQSLALQQQQQQPQPHFGLSGWPVKSPSDSFTSPPNKRGSDASRLSISTAAAAAAATAATSSSYVAALSSRGPRDDVDVPQMRLTLTVKPYHPAAEK